MLRGRVRGRLQRVLWVLLSVRALLIALALAGCYTSDDAVDQLHRMQAKNPIRCVGHGGGYSRITYTCRDGSGYIWECNEIDGCVMVSNP